MVWGRRWMLEAPELPETRAGAVRERWAVLINPFYPKDTHASFGKHVLTPTLALTSVAAATPAGWRVSIRDENLLRGHLPGEKRREGIPAVVGITVHLTFARRAYALAAWYRERGAMVMLGGLHVMSCPAEAAEHADVLAIGEGVDIWPRVLRDVEEGRLRGRCWNERGRPQMNTNEHKAETSKREISEHFFNTKDTKDARRAQRTTRNHRGEMGTGGREKQESYELENQVKKELHVVPEVMGGAVVYRAGFSKSFREDPAPRRELLPKRSFLTVASFNATRGCHNRCGFCYLSTKGLLMPYQTRDVSQVTEEFVRSREPYGVFTDNNLGSKPAYLRELCAGLRPLKKIWSAAVSIDVADDPTLPREMALAGCTGVFVGFESLADENLLEQHKKTPRVEDYARRVRLFHEVGIQVNGSFVLGFDQDGPDVFKKTMDWIEENKLECATFHILTPYPGTPLFGQMEREGRLLHRNWDLYDTAHAVFLPRRMTPAELEAGYAGCYKRLTSAKSIWTRRPGDVRAVLPYLAMSYLYKKCNWLWPWVIKAGLVHAAWRPLVEASRIRHVMWRKKLAAKTGVVAAGSRMILTASV